MSATCEPDIDALRLRLAKVLTECDLSECTRSELNVMLAVLKPLKDRNAARRRPRLSVVVTV